jgi:hypothetical protein
LPAQFLHDKCLLLDYEKKRVGLATRVFWVNVKCWLNLEINLC